MNWFLIALIPPFLWSLTNYIDKYLLDRYFKNRGVGTLMIFSSIIGIFISSFIALIHPESLITNPLNAFLISLNGFLYILGVFFYLHALKRDDTSTVIPLLHLVPFFSYFLAFLFLRESLTSNQIIGSLLIIFGSIFLSFEFFGKTKIHFKKSVIALMTLSSLFFALNYTLFKFFALESSFWTTSFYEYIGFVVFAFLLLVFVKSYRKEFASAVKENKAQILTLSGISEITNIVGKLVFNFVSLLMPIAIISIVGESQFLFIFVIGIVLTILFPKIIKEKINTTILIQKIIAIIIMFVGVYLLSGGFKF